MISEVDDSSVDSAERNFFTAITAVLAIVVLGGFARTFFLKAFFPEAQSFAAPERIFSIHGVVFAAWTGLLVLQALLIRAQSKDMHRYLGWVGASLATLMIILGTWGSLVAAQRPGGFIGVPIPASQFLIFPLVDMILFGILVMLAVIWRHKPQDHKRLMILATVNLIEAAIIRFPIAPIGAGAPFTSRGLSYLFIVAIVVWDLRSSGRIHQVTLWAGLLIIISFPLRMFVSQTEWWADVAGCLIQLVG
jgi:uncharacterized membrane protein YozB (DUF420 family)